MNYGYIELAGIIQEIPDRKILVQTVETSVRRRLHSNIYAARLLGLHNTIGLDVTDHIILQGLQLGQIYVGDGSGESIQDRIESLAHLAAIGVHIVHVVVDLRLGDVILKYDDVLSRHDGRC